MEDNTMKWAAEVEAEAEAEAEAVAAFVEKEVGDWDDEATSRARFKALSGQRSDWEPLYLFWRNLIIKVARHLRIFIIRPTHVKSLWFRRAGLSPLCLDRVLVEMHRAGDLLLPHTHANSSSLSRFSIIFDRALGFLGVKNKDSLSLAGDYYILSPLLQERSLEVVHVLSENHWTSCCVITMRKFQDICEGSEEKALAILDYLSAQGRAKLLTINRADPIQGVKVCLAPGADSTPLSVDYSILHLVWTTEKLEQQLDSIDHRYQKSRTLALASIKDGNKKRALRYAAELKLASQSRERCLSFLQRVENVLEVITDAESSKKVSDAIQSSTQALKENQINLEEVERCLKEVDENIDSLKQLDKALELYVAVYLKSLHLIYVESANAYGEIDDNDVEDEFEKLQLGISSEEVKAPIGAKEEVSQTTYVLSSALSTLRLTSEAECDVIPVSNKSMPKETVLETARLCSCD
ncbi:charged multivesicular body protein [Striga asiatica]|uniref:Charged multivesicular body protein n=1 Tax=Striga asiatica TaxID=4170 RepID=A0A5A7Q9F4_STRAF|nr:charged multivesicular body protein [Striga asiatica]